MTRAASIMPTAPSDTRCVTPAPDRWTEEQGRLALAHRVGADPAAGIPGRCEGCGRPWNGQAAHRVFKSQGGLWHPAGLLALCGSGTQGCHGWAHHNRLLALGLGWELPPGSDPTQHAVWLRDPFDPTRARWVLLTVAADADGVRRHIVIPVEPRWAA